MLTAASLTLVVSGDAIYDPRLIGLLLSKNREAILVDPSNGGLDREAGIVRLAVAVTGNGPAIENSTGDKIDIAGIPIYLPSLRRNLRPYYYPASRIARDPGAVEQALIDATQKGAQDFPAMIHAPIEKFLVRRLARTPVTPHQLTIAWIILAFGVSACFLTGSLIVGIVLAFVIGILDGVDGKLARLRVETSDAGKLEHRFDSLFEVGWPSCLAYYFHHIGALPDAFKYLGILVAAQIVDGLAKGVIYDCFAARIEAPNRYDAVVRFFGGRRNVCTWILLVTLILGRPELSVIVMAWWQVATAVADLPHAIWLKVHQPERPATANG